MEKENLEIIRHSLSHILAAAVKELYPDVKLAIGPAIDNGFYYDIDFGETKISDDSLKEIEKKMKHLVKQNFTFERSEMPIDEAIKREQAVGEAYKAEMLEDLKKEGETVVSYYKVGSFTDLCRGPHVENTNKLQKVGFKLDKLAGAYWRGDEKNKMLTRIYGVAFENASALDEFLKLREEAEKRDHRKLGKDLELFMFDPAVGLGLAMWQPKGALLWRIMEDFWYKAHLKSGYELVRTPHIGSRALWETSGHWGFYSDSMYPPLEVGQSLQELKAGKKSDISEEYLLKPMNCPFHVTIYNSSPKSYRELPVRWAECGTVYRYEKSGQLSGLTRVRGFTQDDAHIVCSTDQVEEELGRVVDFILYIYQAFGFERKDVKVYLSVRDKESNEYPGSDEGWDFTEKVLEKVAEDKKLDVTKDIGGAAFYGPKLDFKVKDALGREWQCSTLQFDFNLPERFEMSFVNAKGEKERPYMLHRALLGSFERFIGVLIEHYSGAFPVWLSPVQVKIVSVGEGHIEYCQKLADGFKAKDVRVELDINNETVGNKIRKASGEKIPYVLVVGDKEMETGKLTVRKRGEKDMVEMDFDGLVSEIKADLPA